MSAPSLEILADVLGLDSMNQPTPLTFPELLERLYHLRYQGKVTFHFVGGVARAVELSQPVQVPLQVGQGGGGAT